jgi:hypothetical protein
MSSTHIGLRSQAETDFQRRATELSLSWRNSTSRKNYLRTLLLAPNVDSRLAA